MRGLRSGFLGCLSVLLLAGCANYVEVSRQIQRPAEINMAGRTTVLLDPITGPGGEQITSRLKSELQGKGFTVVDRSVDHKRAVEMEDQIKEDFKNEKESTKITRAGVLIKGKVLSNSRSQKVEETTSTIIEGTKKKRTQREVRSWRAVANASLEAAIDVVDLATTQTITTASLKAGNQGATPFDENNSRPEYAGIDTLSDPCYDQVVQQFMHKIAASQAYMTVVLLKVNDNPQNESGIVSVQTDDYARALTDFQAALSAAKGNPKLKPQDLARIVNNIGASQQLSSDFENAIASYKEAFRMDPNEPNYLQHARQCESLMKDAAKLHEQEQSVKQVTLK